MAKISAMKRSDIFLRALHAVWLLSFTTGAMYTDSAHAQLRTGRSERSLYLGNAASESPRPVAQSSKPRQSPGPTKENRKDANDVADSPVVVRTSGQSSILDRQRRPTATKQSESSTSQAPSVPKADSAPTTPEVSADDYMASPEAPETEQSDYYLNDEAEYYSSESNCDDMACIAPTCMANDCYFTGGPLVNLISRLSVRAEVPLFWRRAMGVPALVTTSPTGTDASVAGELGQSTTQILLGDRLIDEDMSAGFRITLGSWFGHDCYRGILFRYWTAGDQDNDFNFTHTQFPILARPFNNVTGTAAQDTQLIAFPGESEGSIRVNTTSQVDGLDIALRRLAYQDRFTRVDWLIGYQRAKVDESLSIHSSTTVTGAVPGLQGSSIAVRDTFQTENDFNGFMLGLMSTRRLACWSFESKFRLGMGNLRRQVNLSGSTTTTSAQGDLATEAQGLLVRNTNNNPFSDDTFIVVPEVGLDIAYQLTSTLDFNVGYNYLLIPKVAQPGQQIDPNLSVNLSDPLTGALRPQLTFDERRYWVHSLNLGLQWRY